MGTGDWLFPEEVLYLVDSGSLEVTLGQEGAPLSVEECHACLEETSTWVSCQKNRMR